MKLTLEQYPNWLSQELDKLVRPTTARGRKLVDESSRALEEARGFFLDLSKKGDKDMASKRDPVSYRAARLVGHSAGEASLLLGKIQPPHEVTWDSLKSFKDSLSGLTRSLRDIRNKTSAQLSGFYILDMRSFSGVNDRIAKQSERLTHFLEGDGNTLQKARTLSSTVSDLREVNREISEREAETNSLRHHKENLSSTATALSTELDMVDNNSLVKELLVVERNLRNESRHFRTENLAHLKRPLRRLRDLSERGEVPLGLDEREALGLFILSPYRSFLSNKAGPHLKNILENLRVALGSGKLGFKPRKTARVLSQLDQLNSSGELTLRQAEGRTLLARRKKLLEDPNCKTLYESRKQILAKLEKVKTEIKETLERERTLEEKSRVLNRRLQEILTLLEGKTKQYTGHDVQIGRPALAPVSAT